MLSVEGTSDELDQPIKKCFQDEAFVAQHNLISINSINWGRVMVQVSLAGFRSNSVNPHSHFKYSLSIF